MPARHAGRHLMSASSLAGRMLGLLGRVGVTMVTVRASRRELFRQLDHAGVGSVVVVALITALTGMVLVMQTGPTLETFGVIDTIGAILASAFTLEMGPLWAAVIVLARVGSAMAAELGTMAVNEELDALRVMDIDPLRYLVLPRILALVIVLPLLACLGVVIGMAGGAAVANSLFGVTLEAFLNTASQNAGLPHLINGLIKAAVYGLIIGIIACDQGLHCRGGAAGVGRATTDTVRIGIVCIMFADLLLTAALRAML
jgi:phospholipid/cholesterol/gamma-HCH transport system permease protein